MSPSPEERHAIEEFKTSPAAQGEMRPFLAQEGAEFGRALCDHVAGEISPGVLLSNSGRCAVADVLIEQLEKQARRLRGIGHDDLGIATFMAAAKAEIAWLGV